MILYESPIAYVVDPQRIDAYAPRHSLEGLTRLAWLKTNSWPAWGWLLLLLGWQFCCAVSLLLAGQRPMSTTSSAVCLVSVVADDLNSWTATHSNRCNVVQRQAPLSLKICGWSHWRRQELCWGGLRTEASSIAPSSRRRRRRGRGIWGGVYPSPAD